MNKPVVHYDPSKTFMIEVGVSGFICPVDHPSELVSNTKIVRTSIVKKHDKSTGVFETENTIYRPIETMVK